MDNCSNNASQKYEVLVILEGSLCGTGVLICALSIVLTAALRLHKRMTYRLAIYQVSSALVYGTVTMLTVVRYVAMVHTDISESSSRILCLAHAFLAVYTMLVKLLFTIIITAHLFSFAVCYKNSKNLEVCYVITSLLVPAILAAVPFATNTYGQQGYGSPWCWIMDTKSSCPSQHLTVGIIEIFTLVYGPIAVSLFAAFLLMAIMLLVLAYRVRSVSSVAAMNKTVVRQILPLVAYPILFYILMLISMIIYVCDASDSQNAYGTIFQFVDRFTDGGVIWSAGLTLLAHISVMQWSKRRQLPRYRMIAACND